LAGFDPLGDTIINLQKWRDYKAVDKSYNPALAGILRVLRLGTAALRRGG